MFVSEMARCAALWEELWSGAIIAEHIVFGLLRAEDQFAPGDDAIVYKAGKLGARRAGE